ncbi:MAG TPA: tRNA 2-selenouridine(34) synthase MnmH [Aliiroseovarius sp.]|nr:tRNA 2-selenouridine(34) synthase MnmH [Aliiroseovarius sp.]
MPYGLTSLSDLSALPFTGVVDVRSPAEYAEDHIPGALNLPALDNEERAEVGTLYVQTDRFLARRVGAALLARNAAAHLEGPLAQMGPDWRPLVYCWRGGQRSGAFTTILKQVGWQAKRLQDGYRAYRKLVARALYETPLQSPVVLIDGGTGTATTRLLAALAAQGAQVVDLEGLANHRGSLFGGTGTPQPAQKGFETALAFVLEGLDATRPLYVEAESSKIGQINLPPQLWKSMRAGQRVRLSAPLEARVGHLLVAYEDMLAAPERFGPVLDKLVRFHGHEQVDAWRAMVATGAYGQMAGELITRHYDPRYTRSAAEANDVNLPLKDLSDASLTRAAKQIIGQFGG